MWPFRRRSDEDFRREVEAHLALERDRLIDEGVPVEDARYVAARAFGNTAAARERFYESRRILWLDHLRQDVRYATRALRRSPVFAAAAILTLGLAIGANTALFTVTRGVLLKTLPVERPEELVEIGCINPRNPEDACRTHYPGFLTFRAHADGPADIFAFAPTSDLAANIDGRAEVVGGLMLSGNAYAVLGINPQAGRLLTPADDEPGATLVAVLSHQFWRRRFGADPGVIGRTLRLDNRPVAIVGVTPPGFRGLTVGMAPDVMLPIGAADVFRRRGSLQSPAAWWVYMMGRLKPGTTLEQAQAALEPTFRATLRMTLDALPAEAAGGMRQFVSEFRFRVTPAAAGGISDFRRMLRRPLWILWGVVALIHLIACANLAGLLLSRTIDRQREFGVRLALGAGRARLARQVLTESLVLAFAGGAAGLAIAGSAASLALGLGAGEAGLRAVGVRPDPAVFGFAVLTSIATGLAIGLGAVWRATTANPAEAWRASLGHRLRVPLGRTLVAGQMALATVLLVATALFVRSLANARATDPGFDSAHLVTFTVAPGVAGLAPDAAIEYLRRVLDAAESLPGVRAATYHAVPIATGLISQNSVTIPGFAGTAEQLMTGQNRVGPRFVETLGLTLIAGRDFRRGDELATPRAAIVNERFARQFFKTTDVLGRTFALGRDRCSIVGVVASARDRSVVQPAENWVYVPMSAEPRVRVSVRAAGPVQPVAAALERSLQAIDPAVPVYGIRAVSALIDETLRRERLLAALATTFGALALVLVAIGVYAMFSSLVSRRRREIGIRMAIGASAADVVRLLIREASLITVCGVGAGAAAAAVAGRIVRAELFGVEPTDGPSLLAATGVLLAAIAMAVSIPAGRAVRIQPAPTLRAE